MYLKEYVKNLFLIIIIIIIIIIINKLHKSLKLFNISPDLYITRIMQKTAILNTCRIVIKLLAEQCIISAWSVRPVLFVNQLNCCEVRNVDANDNDKDGDAFILYVQIFKVHLNIRKQCNKSLAVYILPKEPKIV